MPFSLVFLHTQGIINHVNSEVKKAAPSCPFPVHYVLLFFTIASVVVGGFLATDALGKGDTDDKKIYVAVGVMLFFPLVGSK